MYSTPFRKYGVACSQPFLPFQKICQWLKLSMSSGDNDASFGFPHATLPTFILHPARVKVCSRKGPHHTQCLPSLYLHSISSLVSYPEQAMGLQTGTGFQLHIFVSQDAPVCSQTQEKPKNVLLSEGKCKSLPYDTVPRHLLTIHWPPLLLES